MLGQSGNLDLNRTAFSVGVQVHVFYTKSYFYFIYFIFFSKRRIQNNMVYTS